MTKKYYLIVALIALIISTASIVTLAKAEEVPKKNPNKIFKMENREAIQKAIENNDYETWKSLVGNQKIAKIITKDNWAKFVEMHKLFKQARAIREELGLLDKEIMCDNCLKLKKSRWSEQFKNKTKAAIEAAFKAGDYQAWLAAVGENNPLKDYITADNFTKFSEAYKLIKAGDFNGAQKIFDELGIPKPPHQKFFKKNNN